MQSPFSIESSSSTTASNPNKVHHVRYVRYGDNVLCSPLAHATDADLSHRIRKVSQHRSPLDQTAGVTIKARTHLQLIDSSAKGSRTVISLSTKQEHLATSTSTLDPR